jgi:hypothetical protein
VGARPRWSVQNSGDSLIIRSRGRGRCVQPAAATALPRDGRRGVPRRPREVSPVRRPSVRRLAPTKPDQPPRFSVGGGGGGGGVRGAGGGGGGGGSSQIQFDSAHPTRPPPTSPPAAPAAISPSSGPLSHSCTPTPPRVAPTTAPVAVRTPMHSPRSSRIAAHPDRLLMINATATNDRNVLTVEPSLPSTGRLLVAIMHFLRVTSLKSKELRTSKHAWLRSQSPLKPHARPHSWHSSPSFYIACGSAERD